MKCDEPLFHLAPDTKFSFRPERTRHSLCHTAERHARPRSGETPPQIISFHRNLFGGEGVSTVSKAGHSFAREEKS